MLPASKSAVTAPNMLKTNKERILATALGAIVVFLGSTVGWKMLLSFRQQLDTQIAQAESKELEYEGWIKDEAFWAKREKWLLEKQPHSNETRKDSLDFLREIENSASANGVQISGKSILETQANQKWVGTPIRLEASGGFSSLVKWLHKLQMPAGFVRIRELTIKASAKPELVDCSMEIVKCYRPQIPQEETP